MWAQRTFISSISFNTNPGTACQLDDQAWFKPKKPKQEQQHKPQKEPNQQQNLLQRKVDDSW